jgi:hypothetical protein
MMQIYCKYGLMKMSFDLWEREHQYEANECSETNKRSLIVPKDKTAKISSLADLTKPSLKIILEKYGTSALHSLAVNPEGNAQVGKAAA